jgi:3-oxoacyl-[acyl-carrier protein] reductase
MSNTDNSPRTFLALAAAVPSALAMTGIASAQTSDADTQPGAKRAAVVTGSSRGIGAATARRLAQDGFAVTVNYLTNRDLAEAVVRDIEAAGGRAIVRQGDVDPTAVIREVPPKPALVTTALAAA